MKELIKKWKQLLYGGFFFKRFVDYNRIDDENFSINFSEWFEFLGLDYRKPRNQLPDEAIEEAYQKINNWYRNAYPTL